MLAVANGAFSTRENPYNSWNAALGKTAETFASRHEDVTVLIYSSHATFTKILDNPEKYGFNAADVRKPWASVWVDQLHPTSKVHRVVAQDVAEFLGTVGIN
jgi:phospholipase/lecithinase/hemolysin